MSKKFESLLAIAIKSFTEDVFKLVDERLDEKFNQLKESDSSSKTVFTAQEVCEKYKFSKSTLERHVRNGLTYSSKEKGFKRLFKQKDIEKFFKTSGLTKKLNYNG